MKYHLFLAVSTAASLAAASSEEWKRASAQAPSGYAPAKVDCPATRPAIRSAKNLSPEEISWLQKRRPNTIDPMRDLLVRAKIPNFDAGAYIDKYRHDINAIPNIAIAMSGGGYRAFLNGAGAMSAFDSRTPGATGAGQIGGLLQSATYVSALSGGSWLVGSIYANNFSSVTDIASGAATSIRLWQFQNDLLQGPPQEGIRFVTRAQYFQNIYNTTQAKSKTPDGKFSTSITDFYGRALSFQLIDSSDGAPAFTFSSIQNDSDFSNGRIPMPILVSDERAPGAKVVSTNATVFEFNPFEMGSFDPTTFGFAPLRYLGSKFSNGVLHKSQACISGFDNFGFIMGTSSSLFNAILLHLNGVRGIPKVLKVAIAVVLRRLGKNNYDIANYSPNPFFGFRKGSNPNASSKLLTLVDGGEDGQNIPLSPVIQPTRKVDVIFAVDSSADTVGVAKNWPNGTAMQATYERSASDIMNKTSFPYVPSSDTFVALGLNNRPTFFGCNSTNVTQGDNVPPLIVYIPNSPYSYYSNTSTMFKLRYTIKERDAMISNGYNVATLANSTRNGFSNWPTCVGCAVIARSLQRNKEELPKACQQCFQQYCWNGTTVETAPSYNPSPVLSVGKNAII